MLAQTSVAHSEAQAPLVPQAQAWMAALSVLTPDGSPVPQHSAQALTVPSAAQAGSMPPS
jgi:hypothetical protein